MKKLFKLASLSLLTLSLVGCTPKESTPEEKVPANVVDKWVDKLQENIRLEGKVTVTSTEIVKEGDEKKDPVVATQDLTIAFSEDKYYRNYNGKESKFQPFKEEDVDPEDTPEVQDEDRKIIGETITKVVNEKNKIRNLHWVDTETKKGTVFAYEYDNPFTDLAKDEFKIIDDNSFTVPEDKVDDVARKVSGLSNTFNSLVIKDTANTLSINLAGEEDVEVSNWWDGSKTKYHYSYVVDFNKVTVDAGDAFKSARVSPTTSETAKVKEALDEMKSLETYSVHDVHKENVMDMTTFEESVEKIDQTLYVLNSQASSEDDSEATIRGCVAVGYDDSYSWAKFSDGKYWTFFAKEDENKKINFEISNLNEMVHSDFYEEYYTMCFDYAAPELFEYNATDDSYVLNEFLRDTCAEKLVEGILPDITAKQWASMGVKDFKLKLKTENGKSHFDSISVNLNDFDYSYTYDLKPVDLSKFDFNIATYSSKVDPSKYGEYIIEKGDESSYDPLVKSDGIDIVIAAGEGNNSASITINGTAITGDIIYIGCSLQFKYVGASCNIVFNDEGTITFSRPDPEMPIIAYPSTLTPKAILDLRKAAIKQLDDYDSANKTKIDALQAEDKAKVSKAREEAEAKIQKATKEEDINKAVQDYKDAVEALINPQPAQ